MQTYKCIVHDSDDYNEILGTVLLKEDQLILPQLEEQNIPINSDCREGICSSCETKLIKGKVIDQLGEERDETMTNKFRPCVCYAQSDLEIQLID